MKTMAIIGAQWGDEGKGKITDYLGMKSDVVVRYQGGNNAGHTIIVGEKKIVLHLLPSGILHDHCSSVIGHGVVLDPEALVQEMEKVKAAGVSITQEKLKISSNCSIITYYNKLLDGQREAKASVKIGTTGKGIGPTYEDKISRKGIKLKDLASLEKLEQILERNLEEKRVLFEHHFKVDFPSAKEEAQRLFQLGKIILPFMCDTFSYLDQSIQQDKNILFEGAQGVLLDIDYGSYPFVTSSNTSFGGIYTGAGLAGKNVDEVIGITKAYTTRVGEGPFPTELFDDLGEEIQTIGGEFGATTGRKRRCGWLDLPLLKYTVKASNLTSIALTKLDVLGKVDTLKVCYAYDYEGQEIDCAYPGIDMYKVKPLYKDLKVFKDDFDGELSEEVKDFIQTIESHINVPVGIIAYGPEREQMSFLKPELYQ